MALGNGNYKNNNNDKEDRQTTVFCPISMKSPEAECDPSELSFSYWKNTIKVSISPLIQNSGNPYPTYDHQNQGSIWLNHEKARILYAEIAEFLKDPNAYNNMGVTTNGQSLISISNGKEFGVNSPILVIRKINGESGEIESSYMYQFKTNHTSIRNFDEVSKKYDTANYEQLEIYSFMSILKSFYESMSYAMAYTIVNQSRFINTAIMNRLDALMDNAGIKRQPKPTQSAGKSFFDMAKQGAKEVEQPIASKQNEKTTIDELAAMIG